MRKKSHIALTTYLIKSMEVEALHNYKKSFYFGSILPDCVPSFLTRRHCIEDTFEIVKKEIKKITTHLEEEKGITSSYARRLGVVTHYVADYFTYPHNHIFPGTLGEHCTYENHLKFAIKDYVKSDEAVRHREKVKRIRTVDEICDYIKEMHNEYLLIAKEIKTDCEYIVKVCQKVVDVILQYFELSYEATMLKTKGKIA